MDLNSINANINRLLTNIWAVISFLKEFAVDGAKDVSITYINADGSESVKTFPNIAKMVSTMNMTNDNGVIKDLDGNTIGGIIINKDMQSNSNYITTTTNLDWTNIGSFTYFKKRSDTVLNIKLHLKVGVALKNGCIGAKSRISINGNVKLDVAGKPDTVTWIRDDGTGTQEDTADMILRHKVLDIPSGNVVIDYDGMTYGANGTITSCRLGSYQWGSEPTYIEIEEVLI